MDSISLAFIGYGLLGAVAIGWARSPKARAAVLAALSVAFLFLAGATPDNIAPMAAFLGFGYAAMLLAGRRRALLPALLVGLVVAFAYLKRYTFFPEASLLARSAFTLGLSYILFRVLHLVVEAGERDSAAPLGPVGFVAYTLNFTTLVSGPIQRYEDFQASLARTDETRLSAGVVVVQLARIALGYFKVNVVASLLDIVRSDALIALGHGEAGASLGARAVAALVLTAVYPLYLYANFSGYIDVVIALARLMRIRLPENFDRPFFASSFLDFWNRWHMTLSQWLKFYVYNPLLMVAMRRVSYGPVQPYLGVLCFFVTFFLIGIWHGRSSEFVVFGLMQGTGVAVNKLWQIFMAARLGKKGYRKLAERPLYLAFGRGLTYAWFALTMFWFWGDWHAIGRVFSALPAAAWAGVGLALVVGAGVALSLVATIVARLASIAPTASGRRLNDYGRPVLLGAMLFASFFYCALLDQPAPGIIYKAF